MAKLFRHPLFLKSVSERVSVVLDVMDIFTVNGLFLGQLAGKYNGFGE